MSPGPFVAHDVAAMATDLEMNPDDTDKTRVDTPSAMARLGLEDCPVCQRTGALANGDVCAFCDGGRVVDTERAAEWRRDHEPHS